MTVVALVLPLALVLGGAGFALHVLWWIALAALVVWLLGFVFRGPAAGRRTQQPLVPMVSPPHGGPGHPSAPTPGLHVRPTPPAEPLGRPASAPRPPDGNTPPLSGATLPPFASRQADGGRIVSPGDYEWQRGL